MDKMCPKRRQQCKVIMHVVDKGIAGLNNTHKKQHIYGCITSRARVDNLSLDHSDSWQPRDTSCHVVQSNNGGIGGGPRFIKSLSPSLVSVLFCYSYSYSPNTNQQRCVCSLLQAFLCSLSILPISTQIPWTFQPNKKLFFLHSK